jgi:hypothetical protein
MFAINHAATGLIIKKIYPDVSIVPILVSVQIIEILWVLLNLLGVEKTTTEDRVQSVRDIHLAYMPFSHSVGSTAALAGAAWLFFALGFEQLDLGNAIALGICSHLLLDLLSHARDIAIAPFSGSRKYGLGLYEKPVAAFAVETIYGIFCWWVYGGSSVLFWIIVGFNLANASFFIQSVPGPEGWMSHRPVWIAAIVALQIIVTAVLVGLFS